MCPPYSQFCLVYYFGQSVQENLVNQSYSFEDAALNVDSNKTQNLELLLDVADFETSSQWKTLSNMNYTKPWDANWIGFEVSPK